MLTNEIKNRRSIRSFKKDMVKDEDVMDIIKAVQFAPTSHNNHAVEFVVIKDQGMKNAIFGILDQDFLKDAPVVMALVVDRERSELPVEDLSVASAFVFLQAAALGLGTVWKHLSPEWAEQVKSLLGLPESYVLINLIPIGYPDEEKDGHTDQYFSEKKIHTERW